ncbi:YeeE/YedE family protein [Aestuariibius sp. 2305UL40-4]|uniref:YeeE/YedE family protein n=1 Tax=Aestuariibius violaceus TaxID=3234132 RepID=UPI00345ED1F4
MIPMDWILGLIGGLMIGSAAAFYLLVSGGIMGASGLLGGLVDGTGRNTAKERLAFVTGTIATPAAIALLVAAPATNITTAPWLLIAGGLLVGFGTRIGNGCTSGHGVCGISRLAPRGIVATLVYLGAGFATMALLRHGLGVI